MAAGDKRRPAADAADSFDGSGKINPLQKNKRRNIPAPSIVIRIALLNRGREKKTPNRHDSTKEKKLGKTQ